MESITDGVSVSADSVLCFEMNSICLVGNEFAAIALKDSSGANLQKNLISNCKGMAVYVQG
jgi:hypothetical protein